MSRVRRTSEDEAALWRRAMRDVLPLPGSTPLPAPEPAEEEAVAPTVGSDTAPRPRRSAALAGATPTAIDRRSWQRLRRGRHAIGARLDLHGMTQTIAHGRLTRFLAERQGAGDRWVLVITGKGAVPGLGVLRQAVPRWLAEAPNRQIVVAWLPAGPEHGGDGALYVQLRRARKA